MDFSVITDYLIIGTTPRDEAYHTLRDLGVRLVINMRYEKRPYPDRHTSPIPALWLPTVDSPLFPIPIRSLKRGANAALPIIDLGGSIYVHCQAGRHRGVAMGSAILIAKGYEAEAAMQLVKEKRPVADPGAWYIRRQILRFAKDWNRVDGRSSKEATRYTGDQ